MKQCEVGRAHGSNRETCNNYDLLSRDKKAIDGLTFVLDGPRGVEPVSGIDPELVRATFEAVR